MAKRVQLVRHAASVALNFLGLEGEVTVDVTNNTAIVHDGVTTGGTPLARKDLVNVDAATASNAGKMTAAQAGALAQALLDIVTNAGDIATNTGDIATNVTDIGTNVTDIGTNATAILLRAIKDATPTLNEVVKQDGSGDLSGAGFLAAAVVLLTTAQTLTNKTLTAPIINALQLNGALTGDAFSADLAVSADADEGVFAAAAKAYTDAVASDVAALGLTLTAGDNAVSSVISSNTLMGASHGFGALPDMIVVVLELTGASESGYATGDQIVFGGNEVSGIGAVTVYADTTNTYIATDAAATYFDVCHGSGGSNVTLTSSRWTAKATAYKFA